MATTGTMGYQGGRTETPAWVYRLTTAVGLCLAVVLLGVITVSIVNALASTSSSVVDGSAAQFWSAVPVMIVPTLLVLVLFPMTFGGTIVAAAAIFAIVAPLCRERVRRHNEEADRYGGFGADAHMHIPELGFDSPTG